MRAGWRAGTRDVRGRRLLPAAGRWGEEEALGGYAASRALGVTHLRVALDPSLPLALALQEFGVFFSENGNPRHSGKYFCVAGSRV